MNTNDLREKIAEILEDWQKEVDDKAVAYEHGHWAIEPDSPETIADRILALLPKMPELRWRGQSLELGVFELGDYAQSVAEDGWMAAIVRTNFTEAWLGTFNTESEARAAVEKAVRQALGWAV